MPVRQGNKRETSPQKGIDYSDAVIEFQDHLGYFLEARAEDSGEPEDLVFIPKAGNRSKIVAEAKYRSSESNPFSPNDYVEELAKRFYQWEEGAYQGYEFHLFTSKASNEQLWLDLFKRLKQDTVESFYEKMLASSEGIYEQFLEKHESSRFKRFLENCYIWIDYDIGDFDRIIQRDNESNEYGYDPYAVNYEPVYETGVLKSNLLEVAKLPDELYRVPAVDSLSTSEFHSYEPHKTLPIHYHNGDILSLLHPDEFDEETKTMCVIDSCVSEPFADFATNTPSESETDISKVLIKGIITTIADEIGAEANTQRRGTRLFMRHDPEGEDEIKINGQWVTKQLETGEVRHRSVSVFVKKFVDDYYIGLYPTIEFTRDGENLVSSQRKKYLSDRYNPGKFPQNSRKSSTVEIWLSELALEQSLTRFELPNNLRNIQIQRVEGLELEGVRPPRSGEERNQLITDQLSGVTESGDLE